MKANIKEEKVTHQLVGFQCYSPASFTSATSSIEGSNCADLPLATRPGAGEVCFHVNDSQLGQFFSLGEIPVYC